MELLWRQLAVGNPWWLARCLQQCFAQVIGISCFLALILFARGIGACLVAAGQNPTLKYFFVTYQVKVSRFHASRPVFSCLSVCPLFSNTHPYSHRSFAFHVDLILCQDHVAQSNGSFRPICLAWIWRLVLRVCLFTRRHVICKGS